MMIKEEAPIGYIVMAILFPIFLLIFFLWKWYRYASRMFDQCTPLYYILSHEWDLRVLRKVLSSGIAHLFVSVYSTRMRGGYLRFQAQYLRRIRLPRWEHLDVDLQRELAGVQETDIETIRNLVAQLYSLTPKEIVVLQEVHSECL